MISNEISYIFHSLYYQRILINSRLLLSSIIWVHAMIKWNWNYEIKWKKKKTKTSLTVYSVTNGEETKIVHVEIAKQI